MIRLNLLTRLAFSSLAAAALPTAAALAASAGDTATFKLDHLNFTGNQQVSTPDLQAAVGLKHGDAVDHDIVVNALDSVIALYKKQNVGGSFNPKMTYPRPGHIDLTFEIAEQAPVAAVHVAPILDHETVTGNVKVSSDKLAPALTLKPGEALSVDKIKAEEQAILAVYKASQTGVGLTISPKISNTTEGHVDLNFELTETKPKPPAD